MLTSRGRWRLVSFPMSLPEVRVHSCHRWWNGERVEDSRSPEHSVTCIARFSKSFYWFIWTRNVSRHRPEERAGDPAPRLARRRARGECPRPEVPRWPGGQIQRGPNKGASSGWPEGDGGPEGQIHGVPADPEGAAVRTVQARFWSSCLVQMSLQVLRQQYMHSVFVLSFYPVCHKSGLLLWKLVCKRRKIDFRRFYFFKTGN